MIEWVTDHYYGDDTADPPEHYLVARYRYHDWVAAAQQLFLQLLMQQSFQHLCFLGAALFKCIQCLLQSLIALLHMTKWPTPGMTTGLPPNSS